MTREPLIRAYEDNLTNEIVYEFRLTRQLLIELQYLPAEDDPPAVQLATLLLLLRCRAARIIDIAKPN